MLRLALIAALLLAPVAGAQDSGALKGQQAHASKPDHQASVSEEVLKYVSYNDSALALVGVTVIDGTGRAPESDQVALIERGRIRAVGRSGSIDIPRGARLLRLSGRTVIPGLVGMHDHTHMPGITFMGYTASRLWLANGADVLGVGAELGRVAPSFVADLVVLQGDLAADPAAIRSVEIIFKDGTGYDPKKLIADVNGQVGFR